MEIIAYHGWGFDHTCWQGWSEILPDAVSIAPYDRGYFGDEINPMFKNEEEPCAIFTHSFGLHMIPGEQLNRADLVVIFGGFIRFHPVAAQFRRRSRTVLRKMIEKFQQQPDSVLQAFMQNTYYPQEPEIPEFNSLNRGKLLNDLKLLNESHFDPNYLKNAGKVCILHGTEDAIVPNTKGRELYESLQSGASYLEVKDGGHALPFTHRSKCWSFIRPELEEILAC